MTVSSDPFKEVPLAPPDLIFHIAASHKADPNPDKINLGIGAYRDNAGKPWVLPVVRKAEKIVLEDQTLDHEYLPINGLGSFADASAKVILGEASPAIAEGRAAAVQTISGTGAVRLGAEFLAAFHKTPVYISDPTWANHRAIFEAAGMEVHTYPYWDKTTRGLAYAPLLAAIEAAPAKSIFVLHACAHNPTGVDPTPDQWAEICALIKKKEHFCFFDCAYQGFASGDLDKDAAAVRHFVDQGLTLFVAQSYSKNFGLYNERTGALTFVAGSKDSADRIRSQLSKITRAMISNPPAFGARLVSTVLSTPALYEEWKQNLKEMSSRIIKMRHALRDALVELGTPGNWDHIVSQIGMFSFTGLSKEQCDALTSKYHAYLTPNGRISMAGLNENNVRRFAEGVDYVVRNH